MLVSLQEAASFLQTHHPIVAELWRRREDTFSDAEMLALIASTQPDATSAYLLVQLKRLRFVVEADVQAGEWELATPFRRWVEFLQLTARPVSSAVVRGRLQALEHLVQSFRLAQARPDLAEGRDVLREARAEFQALAEDLGQTRAAIAAAVSAAKGEHQRQSAVERFRRINRLWGDYLLPMLELLDPNGALEEVCGAWERQLEHALNERFLPDRRMGDRIESEMRLLRVAVRHSFSECRREMEPLHARLRRDSLWAEGASRLLRRIETEGAANVSLETAMPVSTFRLAGQMSAAALLASAAEWSDFRAAPTAINFSAGAAEVALSQTVEEMLAEIERLPADLFPLPDLLDWLGREFGDRGFHPLLQVFSLVVTDARYVASFAEPIVEYELAGGIVRCGNVNLAQRRLA